MYIWYVCFHVPISITSTRHIIHIYVVHKSYARDKHTARKAQVTTRYRDSIYILSGCGNKVPERETETISLRKPERGFVAFGRRWNASRMPRVVDLLENLGQMRARILASNVQRHSPMYITMYIYVYSNCHLLGGIIRYIGVNMYSIYNSTLCIRMW